MRPVLLLTRPDPQSRRFAVQAQAVCPAHDVLIAPLSTIAPIPFDPSVFDGAKGLILTSANAVPMLRGLPLAGLPAWCVGPATAKAAAQAGFAVLAGGGDAEALIAVLAQARPIGPLVHAHGVHIARDLVAALRPRGIGLRGVAVYDALPLKWPPTVLDAIARAGRVVAPLFSPRAAQHFVQQLNGHPSKGLRIVAISDACAAQLPPDLRAQTTIAASPDSGGMLHALAAEMSQS